LQFSLDFPPLTSRLHSHILEHPRDVRLGPGGGVESQLVDGVLLDGVMNGGQAEEAHRVALDLGILVLVNQRGPRPIEAVEDGPYHVAQIVHLGAL